jgi:hypothetical protein
MRTPCFLWAIALILLVNISFAQPKKEVKEYVRANVWPVLKSERIAFDAKLSAQERALISQVRASLKAEREANKALMQSLREAKKNGTLTEAQREPMWHAREKERAIEERLLPVLEAHRNDFQEMKGRLNMDQWKADIKEMMEKAGERPPHEKQGEGPRHKGGKGMPKDKGPLKAFMPIRFLLLDPQIADWPKDFDEDDEAIASSLYPNPASGRSSQLSVSLQSDGPCLIEIMDKDGKLLKTVFNGSKEAGTHSFVLDVSDLPAAVYFYRVSANGQTTTERFIVEK